ncbi:MAG: hypothetical protein ABIR50_07225 [Ginsengibacter sp.]
MKKSILMAACICFAGFAFAQSAKYESAMKTNITGLDSIRQNNNADELANNFVRIGDAEKTQWLPYYYAAYCKAIQAMAEKDNSKKDALADKATELITKAESILGKENSETDVIKSLIATAHMTVDPASRYMTYSEDISGNIEKSETLDPTNPRPVLVQAQNAFYTPEQYGGGKDLAKTMFDKAKKLYEDFKPESDLSPMWGEATLNYFLSQYK